MRISAEEDSYRREAELVLPYKGQTLSTAFRADLICYESVIVELKAIAAIGGIEIAQVLNTLTVAKFEVGLLLSFATLSLDYRRLAHTH